MRYNQYIDSNVDWIGPVPSTWHRLRIKFGVRRSAAGVWGSDEKGDSNDVACFRIADFDYNYGILKLDNITIRNIEKSQLQGRLLSVGDLLIEKSGGGDATPVGRVVRVNYEGKATCSNFVHSISLNEKLDSNFMYYYFHYLYANKVNLLFFNQTTGLQNLKVADYLSQSIYIPTLIEQKQIASYLDHECKRIDNVIASQQKRIELLHELKQSIITRAVTHGINPNVKMKDSGVDWIGYIPEHWEVVRLKYKLRLINGRAYLQHEFQSEGKYRILRVGNLFTNGQWYYSDMVLDPIKYCEKGDLLYAWSASFGPYIWNEEKVIFHYHIWKVITGKDYSKLYAYNMLQALTDFKRADTHGSTMVHVTMENMNNTYIPFPPIEEQYKIIKCIEEKTKAIDSATSKALRQIDLLKEYKQSLITEVVTGKRKVC